MKRYAKLGYTVVLVLSLLVGFAVVGAAAGTEIQFTVQPGGNMGMPAAAPLPVRLGFTTIDLADGRPKPHVDYQIEVQNAAGTVLFAAGPLHEHEGVFEAVLGPWPPGTYTVNVVSQPTMDTPEDLHFPVLEETFTFEIMPFALDGTAALSISRPGSISAGESVTLTFNVTDGEGTPIIHTDNLVTIVRDDVILFQATNVHIHVPPFDVTYVFAEPGDYEIWFTSAPTPMRASVNFPLVGIKTPVTVN